MCMCELYASVPKHMWIGYAEYDYNQPVPDHNKPLVSKGHVQ